MKHKYIYTIGLVLNIVGFIFYMAFNLNDLPEKLNIYFLISLIATVLLCNIITFCWSPKVKPVNVTSREEKEDKEFWLEEDEEDEDWSSEQDDKNEQAIRRILSNKSTDNVEFDLETAELLMANKRKITMENTMSKTLTAHAAIFKREEDSDWETGIRVRNNGNVSNDSDHIIDMDGKLVGEIWNIDDNHTSGCFEVTKV